ncbi:MAG: antibiotic biosynthesis monooxygenase [Methyloceanibacter sp.]
MFIAMNRFKVPKGSEQAFEELWLSRETHLDGNPGFVVFHLLEGPARQDHVLYFLAHDLGILAFEAWTRSESFRTAHARAGSNKPLYLDHPEFEGFTVLQEVRAGGASSIKQDS